MSAPDRAGEILHGSAAALGPAGVLVRGPAGSGKSALVLQLMALGARLVADDQVVVSPVGDGTLVLSAPAPIRGMIEARGIGLLAADPVASAALSLVVDLAQWERDRLPSPRTTPILDVEIPLLLGVDGPHFAPAVLQYLKGGRCA